MRNAATRFFDMETNAACEASATTKPGDCAFAQHVTPFVKTPIFAVQSIFDGWQLDAIARPPDWAGNKSSPFGQHYCESANPRCGHFLFLTFPLWLRSDLEPRAPQRAELSIVNDAWFSITWRLCWARSGRLLSCATHHPYDKRSHYINADGRSLILCVAAEQQQQQQQQHRWTGASRL